MLICQLTDLHVCARGQAANRVSETNMFAVRAFRAVSALKPDAVVMTGDLTESGTIAEYENLAALIAQYLTPPVFVLPGNHDRRENLRQVMGGLPGVTADPVYVQYAVEDFPVRLVMLDSVVPGAANGLLRPEQLEWLDRTLAARPEAPTIVALHHPPFECGIVHMDKIALRNAEALAGVVAKHKQIVRVICGHHHRPIFTAFAGTIGSVAPSCAHQVELTFDPADKGALNFEPPAYHVHRWTAASGLVTHTAYVEDYPGPFPFIAAAEYPGKA